MAFELKTNLKALSTAGTRVPLRHPGTGEEMQDDKGKVAAVLLSGQDSEQYKKAMRLLQEQEVEENVRQRGQRRPSFEEQKRIALARIDAVDERQVALLVACTLGWEHCAFDGVEEFSPALIERFYRTEEWAADQAYAAILDRARFFEKSKAS